MYIKKKLKKIKKRLTKMFINNRSKKLINVKIVCEKTGWSYKKAKKHMDKCKKIGINHETYISEKLYNLTTSEIIKKYNELQKKEEENIDKVCEITGWSREKTRAEMDRVKNKYGLSYFKYNRYRFYTLNDKEKEIKLRRWKNTQRELINYAVKESGWTRSQIKYHMRKVRIVYDFPPDYYVLYRMWELTDAQIETYAQRKDSDHLYKKYNKKAGAQILKNKELFDKEFNDFIKRKYWTNKNTNYKEFVKFTENLDYIFCKPTDSGGGQGTEKIKISDYKLKDLYNYLINKEKILVEECIKQHPEIDKFAPGCVNTIRVVTLLKNNKCHFISAGIRIGHKGIVDNFHKDGMVCDIDVNTGIIVTPAIDRKGITYEKHPISGYEFVGFKIPNWDKVLELAENAIRFKEDINYVGWDIAICEDKAVIIEGNGAPDLVLIQAPYARKKIGKKYLFEKYF